MLFTKTAFSQRKAIEIYVDYVKEIEHVTFQLQFDSINKLESIKLLNELTTLQDSLKIEKLKEKFNNLNYKSDFKGKSVRLTFRLINEEFRDLKISKKDKKLVQKYFKNGKFLYKLPWSKTVFTRNGNVQYSDLEDQHCEYSVEWYNEYTYTLTLIKKNNPFEKLNIGDKLYIEIIKVLDDKNYLFQCSKEGYTYSQIFTKID